MTKPLDLQQFMVRTDLALEAKELAESGGGQVPGVMSETIEEEGVVITRMTVETEQGAQAIGKLKGRYVTLEAPGLRGLDTGLQDHVATIFAREFEALLQRLGVRTDAKVLIVGLGNWNVTPDSLGPLVVENVMITRHFFELMPDDVAPGYRPVSAVSPGVMGTTGIESSDIVLGIVQGTKPELIIAIDALASKSMERVNTTIQIADTGIHPGSGIGNKRRGLTEEILGVPVIAIGIPTVVYASTIVNNTIEMMQRHFETHTDQTGQILGLLPSMQEQERLMLVKEVLEPMGKDMLVTPKEVDQFIEDIANILASGLNAALHDAVDTHNVGAYTH